MARTLKKGPSNHYVREQWVHCGLVADRPANNQAYHVQYLWEWGPRLVFEGFSSRASAIEDMENTKQQMLEQFRDLLQRKFKHENWFLLGDVIHVEF